MTRIFGVEGPLKLVTGGKKVSARDICLFDYVLFTALFQAITNVKRLKPGQIKPVGWIKELATNPPLIRVGYDHNGYNRLCLVHNQICSSKE